MKKTFNKSILLITSIMFTIGLFIIGTIDVQGLTFNTTSETLWGANKISPLINSNNITWRCDKISGSTNLITISNTNGCSITTNNIYKDSTVKIKITRIMNGITSSLEKTLKLEANAVKVNLKIGETYDAGSDFKTLGLEAFSTCSKAFSVSDTNILEKGSCASYKFQAKALKAGTATLQIKSWSKILFRAVITVTDPNTTNPTKTYSNQSKTINVNESFSLIGDSTWCSFSSNSSSYKTSGAAKLTTSNQKCNFQSSSAGTYTVYNEEAISGRNYKYTIVVKSAAPKNITKTGYVNVPLRLHNDTNWCSFSDYTNTIKQAGVVANLYSSDHACYIKSSSVGTYTVYDKDGSGNLFKYTVNIKVNSTPTTTTTTTTTTKKTKPKKTTTTTRKLEKKPEIIDVPVQKPVIEETFEPGYRYIKNYGKIPTYSGIMLSCGDKVYVSSCSGDASGICEINEMNGVKINNTLVYEDALLTSEPSPYECGEMKRYAVGTGAIYYTNSSLTTGQSSIPCGEEVIFEKIPAQACVYGNYKFCEAKYKGSVIYVNREYLNTIAPPKAICEEKCSSITPLTNQTSNNSIPIKVCYNSINNREFPVREDEYSVFRCSKGYRRIMKEDYTNNTCNKLTSSSNSQACSKVFSYSCASNARPTLEGSGSLVRPDGKGILSFRGIDSITNTGLKGYFIYTDKTPTTNSVPTKFVNNNYEVIFDSTPGTYFVSVMTNDNVISYPLTLSVHSDEITTTANIVLSSPDGNQSYLVNKIQNDGTIGYNLGITSSQYVRLSNQLNNDSILATGFDLFTTGYEVTVDADKIAVYATLTSEDASYVEGYGSRTVNLNYGRNIILVKIINNNGKERTYTFVVNRTDNRINENVLSNLTTSVGKISFDSHVSDYTISVPKNSKKVNINGTLLSDTAAFVKGYEPRKISLNSDITSAILKTISEAGITRNYILTFVKTGANIEENIENSLNLSSLTIPGVNIEFDKGILSYSVAVEYETDNVPVYAFAESPNASVEVNGNLNLQTGPNNVEIIVTNGSLKKVYNVFINRKEDSLGISSDTKLKTLTIKNYDILFNPDVEDYTVKIKREKTLLLTATPASNRSEVYMYGNNDLTAYSTVRIKVIAENGDTGLYSVDIIKDLYNRKLETTAAIVGGIILASGVIIVMVLKKRKSIKDYVEA